MHAPLQFALLGVSKPLPPQTGIALNRDDKNLCWHHQALLFYTYHLQDGSGIPPTSLEFTISQPVQAVDHLNRTAVVPASTERARFKLGDWLCLMDGDSHHDWNKNPVEPNSRMPMNTGWLLEWNVSLSLSIHSYADSWGGPYSPKIIVASKRKPSKFTEIKNPRVLAPCGSGATELLLVPGNVPPKVWKHRPPSAKSLKKCPETSAISARKEVTLKIGKKTCPCRMRLKVFLKYSGFPILTVGGLPWPKHTRNPIWLQENQSCRQMLPVFGYLSNFAASYPLLYWLYTHFCCFNLNFSRFNSPIWWLNPVQPLFLLVKNQVFSQRHP